MKDLMPLGLGSDEMFHKKSIKKVHVDLCCRVSKAGGGKGWEIPGHAPHPLYETLACMLDLPFT